MPRRFLFAFILVALLVFAGCSGVTKLTDEPAQYTHPEFAGKATVTRVIDGDTIEVGFQNGRTETIRLIGVDTPETTLSRTDPSEVEGIPDTASGRHHLYNWGQQATQFATDQLAGEQVLVFTDSELGERGRYGRLLAYVYYSGDEFFNFDLIQGGYARLYDSQFAQRDNFAELEAQAQRKNFGLWDLKENTDFEDNTSTPTSKSGSSGDLLSPSNDPDTSDPSNCSDFAIQEGSAST